jgi:hypothetical protein
MDEQELKNQLTQLQKELSDVKKQSTEQRIEQLEKALNEMKERYILLLEHTLEIKGNPKKEISNSSSKGNPKLIQNVQLDNFQMLLLLQKSRATTPEFAVSATQLQTAFALNRTTRTIRDKLTSLELMNVITSFGQKPKLYYLTSKGINMINQQQRGLMQVH